MRDRARPDSSLRPFTAAHWPWVGAGLIATVTLCAPAARAQESAFEGEFSVQRFNPAPGPRNLVVTRGARSDGKMTFSAGFLAHYAFEPFVVRSCANATNCDEPGASQEDVKVVENLVTADLMGSLTIIPELQLGLRVPVSYVDGQGLTPDGTSNPDEINAFALGDTELEGKYRFFGGPNTPVALAAGAFVTAPLGNATASGAYIGDGLPQLGGRLIGDVVLGPVLLGGNVAGVFRDKGRVGTTNIGSEMRYSFGGAYAFSPRVDAVVDVFGSTQFAGANGSNAMEGVLAGRVKISGIHVLLGGGTGFVEGVGVPTVRAFVGVTYVHEPRDRDADGLDDQADKCPTVAEDTDGFEDSDGCPEADNDDDRIKDNVDACPNEAEDPDGFEDTNGCPDADNDKDGVLDDADLCDDEPETKNGFKDEDGCADETDTDGDGVADSKDKCPQEAEDTDGKDDEDGCLDADNDADGVPDTSDECVDEPETKNNFEDTDGCPDEAPRKKR
jgi:hypothetical protein